MIGENLKDFKIYKLFIHVSANTRIFSLHFYIELKFDFEIIFAHIMFVFN